MISTEKNKNTEAKAALSNLWDDYVLLANMHYGYGSSSSKARTATNTDTLKKDSAVA